VQVWSPTTGSLSMSELRATVAGRVITPDDDAYESARQVVNGAIDRRPAVIVRVTGPDDVARVIDVAKRTGLPLAVRSGGHSGAGHSAVDGGIVLDVRDMRRLEIDPHGRTAWAETGLTAGEVSTGAAEHGLVIGFGDTGSVGIGGITLGGGVGYLVRKHGLTIDSLLAAEIVTADGELRRVDAGHDDDLFWAIRGGGGNFGVATRFLFRLHELPSIVGGMLILPATPETIAGFIAACEAAPEELSAIGNVMNCPPMPFVPEEHHGRLVIMAVLAYAGPTEPGERAIAPFRALAEPIADQVREMPYPELFPPEDESYRPTAVAHTGFMDRIDLPVAETILAYLEESDASLRAAQLRVLGGEMARVPADATAFAHRSRRIMINLAAFYEGEQDRVERQAWLDRFAAALRQGDSAAYVNFLVDEGEARVRDAYPGPTWERLAAIKARYDPTNLFRLNHNIPPASSPAGASHV
jgi:hypothetical protein